MKNLYLFFSVILISLFYSVSSHAVKGRAEVYKITMDRMEFCTDSTCDTSVLMCTSSKTVDIASVDAGAEVGSWCTVKGLELNTTYSHYRVRISRSFTIKGTVTDVVGGDDCSTGGSSATAGTVSSYAPGLLGDSQTAVEQVLYVPYGDASTAISTQAAGNQTNENTHAGRPTGSSSWCVGNDSTGCSSNCVCTAANTTYSSTWANAATAGTMQIIYPFVKPFTAGPINPKVIISFDTSEALGAANMNSKCEMYPESPTATVEVFSQ